MSDLPTEAQPEYRPAQSGDGAPVDGMSDRAAASLSQQCGPAERLAEEIEQANRQHGGDDMNSLTSQVEDLMNVSAWREARQLVQQLLDRHPDSAEARQLLLRVEREHQSFQMEQMRRMNAEIQRYAGQRRWEEALAAARAFLARFPRSEDAEILQTRIPTLEANAEIEVRQRMEAAVMEHIRQGRYMEAAELARRIVEHYPESPQAGVLRSHLGRLEQLAHHPDAAAARLRRSG
jgi:outer membrane protein assembly factor BamD (BamD/ComL family)